jgi:hypothetical protein
MQDIAQNKALRKQMIDRHRSAFRIWQLLAELSEEAVIKDRNLQGPFARALDLFFIEAFKSHQSLYLLSVNGHGEDAATIARRLLEISLQVSYLCQEESERDERGATYLAHFWHNAKEVLASLDLAEDRRRWWQIQYEQSKKRLKFQKNGKPAMHWFGCTFAQLATNLGLQKTYEQDYRFLSQMAHCSSRGLLLTNINNQTQIKSDRLIREILVFGTKYALWVTAKWNQEFALIPAPALQELLDLALNFDFKSKS